MEWGRGRPAPPAVTWGLVAVVGALMRCVAGGEADVWVSPPAPAHGAPSHRLVQMRRSWGRALQMGCARRSEGHGAERGTARGRRAVDLSEGGHKATLSPSRRPPEGSANVVDGMYGFAWHLSAQSDGRLRRLCVPGAIGRPLACMAQQFRTPSGHTGAQSLA
eukprot:scaffold193574_cov31-Tisochrysis_lutea.AAC.6